MIDVRTKFITVLVFRLDPGDLAGVAREVQLVAERKGPLIDGLIESVVMANDEKTQLVLVALWESKQAWGAAQWDQDVGRAVTDAVETASSFEVHMYEPIAVVRGATSP